MLHLKIFAHSANEHLTACLFEHLNILVKQSECLSVSVTSKVHVEDEGCSDVVYIVSFPQCADLSKWPNVYRVLYQVEQFPHGFIYHDAKFWKLFMSPWVVGCWDYTGANIEHYPILLRDKVCIVPFPPCIHNHVQRLIKPSIDVLFFGRLNPRRTRIMTTLFFMLRQQGISVTYVYNIFNQELMHTIQKAKIVLNIHYFCSDKAYLETYRLNEILSQKAFVISETPCQADRASMQLYTKSGILFTPAIRGIFSNDTTTVSDTPHLLKLVKLIQYYHKNQFARFSSISQNNHYIKREQPMFAEFLKNGLKALRFDDEIQNLENI